MFVNICKQFMFWQFGFINTYTIHNIVAIESMRQKIIEFFRLLNPQIRKRTVLVSYNHIDM